MSTKTIYVNKDIFMLTKTIYVNKAILCQQKTFYVNKNILCQQKHFMSTKTFDVIGTYCHPVRKNWRLTDLYLFTVKWAVCQLCSWEQVYKQYII